MMKKNIFFALLAAMLLPLGFAACSSNEDNPTAGPVDPDPEHFDPKVRDALPTSRILPCVGWLSNA